MTTAKLTTTIAAMPPHLRHVVAGIVAYHMQPQRGERDAGWDKIWAMARDHGPDHRWPRGEDVRAGLVACGMASKKIDKLIAVYDSYGDIKTPADAGYYTRHQASLRGARYVRQKRQDERYMWSEPV